MILNKFVTGNVNLYQLTDALSAKKKNVVKAQDAIRLFLYSLRRCICLLSIAGYTPLILYFLKRTLCLICRVPTLCESMGLVCAFAKVSVELIAIYFHSFEIFNIEIGEVAFCKPNFIIIKSNYF
jgi:hypothetical protein